jgi:hypothetical protein
MKTVLFIDTTSARYFRREQGLWRSLDKPDAKDKLWVIVNVPEEILESFRLPVLFGSDRSHFIERRLAAAFPHSPYRAAAVLTGKLFSATDAVLSGLSTTETISRELGKLSASVAGVWGMSMLLTLIARRLAIRNVLLVMPSAHYLRILVLKDGIPVITRCIHRYGDDREKESDANEIQRTRQHLENKHIFERATMPPVLYLGNAAAIDEHDLLPLPAALSPKGDAGYLHPLFEAVASSPRGQLAPLQLRARHLAERVRQAAYAGIAASLLAAILFGQKDFRALLSLHQRESTLSADLQRATREQENLAGRIGATGTDPALVRQATKFAALEMEAAPTPESIFQFVSTTIADLPQVRIKNLTFRFPKPGERYCQGQTVIEVPLIKQKIDLSSLGGSRPAEPETGAPLRYTELQFSILLTDNLAPAAQAEVHKRISAVIKAVNGVQLMQDPSAFSLINTLRGGMGMDTTRTENLWCMSIPWKNALAAPLPNPDGTISHSTKLPENGSKVAGYLPQAGEGANESLRESHVKGLP